MKAAVVVLLLLQCTETSTKADVVIYLKLILVRIEKLDVQTSISGVLSCERQVNKAPHREFINHQDIFYKKCKKREY